MDHAELIIAARRARARAMHHWMTMLRAWIAARLLELEQRSRTSAATTASWLWWRT